MTDRADTVALKVPPNHKLARLHPGLRKDDDGNTLVPIGAPYASPKDLVRAKPAQRLSRTARTGIVAAQDTAVRAAVDAAIAAQAGK